MLKKEQTRAKNSQYETFCLVKVSSGGRDTNDEFNNSFSFLADVGSKVVVRSGVRKSLAYSIDGCDTAVEKSIIFSGNGKLVKELNANLKRNESVLRSITTRVAENAV
jgi:ribosomal protein S6